MVMICLLLVLRSDQSNSIVVVASIPYSPTMCNWKSSVETSVMEGEVSFLGLFSLGTYGVVICETMIEGSCCSISTRVFGSHSV
jgi:hypothetical protein